MVENPTTGPAQPPSQQKPARPAWGPGPLMVFGLGALVVAAWCGYDIYAKSDWPQEKILFNWIGLAAFALGAVYAFVLATVRSRKPQEPPPEK